MSTPPVRLSLLAFAAFVFVTAELFPLSSLLDIAADLRVSEGRAGLLVSGYALVVALSVVPVVRLTRRRDRRILLAGTVLVLAVSSALSAVAPSYEVLMLCRIAMATGHGVFWATIGSVATRLAGRNDPGRATAAVFSGNALALIAGVPILNAVSDVSGWRAATVGVAVAAAVAGVLVVFLLPALPPIREEPGEGRSADRQHGARSVLLVSGTTLLLVAAYFATYTYVTPVLEGAGIQGSAQSLTLAGFGMLGLVGIGVTSRTSDKWPLPTLAIQVVSVAAAFWLALLVEAPTLVIAWLALLALAYSGLAVSWQSLVLRVAPTWPDRASARYIVAFQVGITLGPVLGAAARGVGADTGFAVSLAAATAGLLVVALLTRHSPTHSVATARDD